MVGKVKVPFRERYRTSRRIFGQSMRLLGKERDLWLFPLLGVLVMMLGMATLFAVMWGIFGSTDALAEAFSSGSPLVASLVMMAAAMAVLYPFGVVVTLFQTALTYCLNERLSRRPGLKSAGMRRAMSLLGPIARFMLVSTLVSGVLAGLGMVLDKLRLVPYLGKVLQTVGTFAWAAAAFFVIPILVVTKQRSALGALQGSVALAREQWGKAVAGIVTVSLAVMVPMMVVLLVVLLVFQPLMFFAIIEGGELVWWPVFTMLGILFAVILIGSVLSQAAMTAYQVALYRYATKGKVVKPYTKETLADAWAPYQQN